MAVDYFLKIDGIDGESTKKKHEKEIEVLSWSWGESNSGSMANATGGGSGKVAMQDFHFSMLSCVATPELFFACASGKHIPRAVLSCRKAGGEQEDYLKYEFSNVMISSFQTSGSSNSEIPVDSVSFNFAKIELKYKPQNDDGSLGGEKPKGWDLKKMTKV
jgi:type VI secretion system secreted protein Hcp